MRRPDFFLVGAPRCGTTAMYVYLRQHPEIFLPEAKEPNFFGRDLHHVGRRSPRLENYLALFAPAGAGQRAGDCSTSYFFSRTAASEIKEFQPRAQILIMLRNPIDLIYSLYSMYRLTGVEPITDFAMALAAEEERKRGRCLPNTPHYLLEGLLYREVARLASHVGRYLSVFGAENVHVIIYDDFRTDPATVLRRTLEFLGVDPSFQPPFAVVKANKRVYLESLRDFMQNPPRLARWAAHKLMSTTALQTTLRLLWRLNSKQVARPPLNPELRRRLQAEFAPQVDRLSQLLGRDLSHWLAKEQPETVPPRRRSAEVCQ